MQRILDRYGAFVIDKYAAIIVAYCRAAAKLIFKFDIQKTKNSRLNDHLRGDQSVYSSGYSLADSQSSGGLNKPNAIMRLGFFIIKKYVFIFFQTEPDPKIPSDSRVSRHLSAFHPSCRSTQRRRG